uniref:Uncharacterized protein n=1 Tax=Rangifer tarandus platyrhynchus TaxID=3082113 RepID=A0ACB0EYK1_RANTA|nr:unnamed protein product [Rangifer tarandus platyrhynchus]
MPVRTRPPPPRPSPPPCARRGDGAASRPFVTRPESTLPPAPQISGSSYAEPPTARTAPQASRLQVSSHIPSSQSRQTRRQRVAARLSSFLQSRFSGYTGGMREAREGSHSAQGRHATFWVQVSLITWASEDVLRSQLTQWLNASDATL